MQATNKLVATNDVATILLRARHPGVTAAGHFENRRANPSVDVVSLPRRQPAAGGGAHSRKPAESGTFRNLQLREVATPNSDSA